MSGTDSITLKYAFRFITGLSLSCGLVTTHPSTVFGQVLGTNAPESIPQSTNFTQLDTPYVVGPGDRIRIDILWVPNYSGEFDVLVDGSVNLPLIGNLPIQGMTIDQVEAAVAEAYDRNGILKQPTVTVGLLATRPLQVGIAGEVKQPGSYNLSLQGEQPPTLTQLIEMAGGITQTADLSQVQIRRLQSPGSNQVTTINLWQLIQTGDIRQDVSLRDGDSIFIPTASQADIATASQLATASFAADQSQPINVAVVGEVFRPGSHIVTGGEGGGVDTPPTVSRAIQEAGGIKPTADIQSIQVRRPTRTGTEQILEANLWQLLQSGALDQDIVLQDGDTIVIPVASQLDPSEASQIAASSFSPATIRVNVVGEVGSPGVIEIPPNTPLNQAILFAGGFNNRASRNSVKLIRLNLDGTVSQQSLDVDYAEGIDAASNPALQNNDVIVVRRSGLASFSDTLGTVLAPVNGALSILGVPGRLLNGILNLFP